MAELVLEIVEGGKAGLQVPVSDEVGIGRDPSMPLALEDDQVSRSHARLYLQSGKPVVEDLGSANGTYVNDQPVSAPAPPLPWRPYPGRPHGAGAPNRPGRGQATFGGHARASGHLFCCPGASVLQFVATLRRRSLPSRRARRGSYRPRWATTWRPSPTTRRSPACSMPTSRPRPTRPCSPCSGPRAWRCCSSSALSSAAARTVPT